MSDQDIVSKAVMLADGWDIFDGKVELPDNTAWRLPLPQWWLDALATQLVRQVDALDRGAFHCEPTRGIVCEVARHYPFAHQTVEVAEGPDRTMNTLRAIVESGVLDKLREGRGDE